jgi:hypothetical protein
MKKNAPLVLKTGGCIYDRYYIYTESLDAENFQPGKEKVSARANESSKMST